MVEVNGELKEQIMHSYYNKEMASKYVIHRDSANPMKSEKEIPRKDTKMKNLGQKMEIFI